MTRIIRHYKARVVTFWQGEESTACDSGMLINLIIENEEFRAATKKKSQLYTIQEITCFKFF